MNERQKHFYQILVNKGVPEDWAEAMVVQPERASVVVNDMDNIRSILTYFAIWSYTVQGTWFWDVVSNNHEIALSMPYKEWVRIHPY